MPEYVDRSWFGDSILSNGFNVLTLVIYLVSFKRSSICFFDYFETLHRFFQFKKMTFDISCSLSSFFTDLLIKLSFDCQLLRFFYNQFFSKERWVREDWLFKRVGDKVPWLALLGGHASEGIVEVVVTPIVGIDSLIDCFLITESLVGLGILGCSQCHYAFFLF